MEWKILCLFLIFSYCKADECETAKNLAINGKKDIGVEVKCTKNPCKISDPIEDLEECLKYDHCYVSSKKECLTKALPFEGSENDLGDLKKLIPEDSPTGRFFNQGGTNPFVNQGELGLNFMAQNCNPYPFGCDIDPNNPFSVLEAVRPPVDIPYCQRIACNPSQPVFELDRTSCLKNPGCYYDDELATLRRFFGEQILPGVPACHLVVRNHNFHRSVKNEKMRDGSSFNGLYTKCWLKRNQLPVNEGCHVTSALNFFKYPSQQAGWEGITKEECNILGYCPTENGCVVAGNVKSIRTRSAALEKSIDSVNERYGQPLCQQYEFDLKNPAGYLNSYSMCMMSGCAVTSEINTSTLQNALYNVVIASSLSTLQKYQAINMIMTGEMQPHNYKDKIAALQNSCDNSNSWLNQIGGNGFSSLLSGLGNINNPFNDQNNLNPIAPYSLNLKDNGRINSGPEKDDSGEMGQGKQFLNVLSSNLNENPFANMNNLPGMGLGMLGNLGGMEFGSQGPNAGLFGNQNNLNNIVGSNQGGLNAANNLNSIFGGGANGFGQNPFTNLNNNFGCPYSSPTFGNYPALKGKFTGCCKRHQCFYPRSAIHQQHSGVASYYGSWTSWSKCSASCGGGRQERKRDCVSINNQPCEITEANSVEERICNDQQCPQITNWGTWSLCSVTCGLGVKERYRSCIPANSCPNEKLSEQQECSAASECPVFGKWDQYSQCDSLCGPGMKTRQRPCLKNCDSVTSADLRQSVSCYTINGEVREVGENCSFNTNKCSQTVIVSCLKSDGTQGCCGEDHKDGEKVVKCKQSGCPYYCVMPSFKKFCHEVWQ